MKLATKDGKIVKIGDVISKETRRGSITEISLIKVSKDNYKDLIKEGILVENDEVGLKELPKELIEKAAKEFYRKEIDSTPIDRIRKTIRYIAMGIDSNYPDNIKDVKSCWYVDIFNNLTIKYTYADYLMNYYRSIGYGLFRKEDEAKWAQLVIIDILNGKK